MSDFDVEQTEVVATNIVERAADKKDFKSLINASLPALKQMVPAHVQPERLARVAIGAVSRTPLLMECTPISILNGFLQAAQLGLDCAGGVLGHAYLVPFWNKKTQKREAQFIVGYRGLIDLARRSGHVESIEARIVRTCDEFSLELGIDLKVTHKPDIDHADTSPMRLVYGIARLKGGEIVFDYMTKTQVDAIRKRSKSGEDGPWVTDYEEMARKTMLRRIAKYLPMSLELQHALDLSDRNEFVDAEFSMSDPKPAPATRGEQVAAMLGVAPSVPVAAPTKAQEAKEPIKPESHVVEAENAPPAADAFADVIAAYKTAKFDAGNVQDDWSLIVAICEKAKRVCEGVKGKTPADKMAALAKKYTELAEASGPDWFDVHTSMDPSDVAFKGNVAVRLVLGAAEKKNEAVLG